MTGDIDKLERVYFQLEDDHLALQTNRDDFFTGIYRDLLRVWLTNHHYFFDRVLNILIRERSKVIDQQTSRWMSMAEEESLRSSIQSVIGLKGRQKDMQRLMESLASEGYDLEKLGLGTLDIDYHYRNRQQGNDRKQIRRFIKHLEMLGMNAKMIYRLFKPK